MENTAQAPKRSSRRRLEDLTPEERRELDRLNLQVSSTVPPKVPRSTVGGYDEYRYEVRDRFELMHHRARALRSDWLKAHRLSLKEALRAPV
jgi:hypothetical protein